MDTDLPPEEVFDRLADFGGVGAWDPRADDVRLVAGEPGRVGAQHRCTVHFAGRRVPMTYDTTVLDRPRRIEWTGTSRLVRHTDVVDVLPHGDGTRVDYRSSFAFARAPWLLERVLDLPLRRLLDDAAWGLARDLGGARRA